MAHKNYNKYRGHKITWTAVERFHLENGNFVITIVISDITTNITAGVQCIRRFECLIGHVQDLSLRKHSLIIYQLLYHLLFTMADRSRKKP